MLHRSGPVLADRRGHPQCGSRQTRTLPALAARLTVPLLGTAFYNVYRPDAGAVCECADVTCTPSSKRAAKILVWIAAIVATGLIAFPYYIGYLL
ncbi:MAG: hypothetical protein GEU99_16410 [Luteitalea sp.]|nr:hypothetical protein [Luteitalea sp.]